MPFTLTHPKPPPTPSPSRQFDQQHGDNDQTNDIPVDHNLIQLDAKFDEIFDEENEFIERMFFCLVLMEMVMMMILFLKNLLEYVLKVMKIRMKQRLN